MSTIAPTLTRARFSGAPSWSWRLADLPSPVLALLLPIVLLFLWQLALYMGWASPHILPPPQKVLQRLWLLASSGDLVYHLQTSLTRVAWGFLFGLLIGIPLGILMGLSRTAEAYLLPSFKALSLIPPLGWIPLLILLVGIEETLKIVVITKAVVTPVTLSTLKGIRIIPRNYFEVASVNQLSPWQTFRKLILPATVPSLFTGVRYGLSNAWMALVAVELLAASEGIGYLLVWGRQLFQLDLVMACIIVIGSLGLLFDGLFARIETRLLAWRRTAY